MRDVETATIEDVAGRLMDAILGLGVLTHMDAIRIVWNEFGGNYTYETDDGTRGLRRDVLKAMKKLGGDRYVFETHPKRWTRV